MDFSLDGRKRTVSGDQASRSDPPNAGPKNHPRCASEIVPGGLVVRDIVEIRR